VLQKKFTNLFDSRILFSEISDGGSTEIMGYNMTFFDIGSKKDLQYGFTTTLKAAENLHS
jgi:ribonuclease Z